MRRTVSEVDVQQVYIGTTNYGRHWLEPAAAASWARMVRDGCPAAGITDAGRTQQEQIDVFLKYFTTDFATSAKHDPRGWNGRTYWRRKDKPSAATPGSTTARHTFGRALDLNGATKAWVRANGHRYGWIRDLVKGEDWHMEYQPGRDAVAVSNPGTSVPTVPTVPDLPPITPIPEEDIMASRAELQADIKAALAPVLTAIAAGNAVRAYRIAGTDGAYFDYGLGRAALTAERLATLSPQPPIQTLPADDPFWSLPLYGAPSQAFRKIGDTTGAVFYVEDGGLVHVDAARYARDGKPQLKDLPAAHPVWSLPGA